MYIYLIGIRSYLCQKDIDPEEKKARRRPDVLKVIFPCDDLLARGKSYNLLGPSLGWDRLILNKFFKRKYGPTACTFWDGE